MTVRRKADQKGRVLLFEDFAGQTVVVERVSDDEVRIRKAKPRCPSLQELIDGITPGNVHAEVSFGR